MMTRLVVCVSVLTALSLTCLACADTASEGPGYDTASLALLDGSPAGEGVLAFLNDPSTTHDVLDLEVGLDRRAAEHLIAHRDGADGLAGTADDNRFDSLDEVDGVYWVGASALELLAEFTADQGWVPTGDDYLGTWDGVSFTALEAALILELANRSPYDELDIDVELDKRAVDSIFASRPLDSVKHLSLIKRVGPVSLQKMKTFAVERFESL